MVATIRTIDFSKVGDHREHPSGINRDGNHKDLRPEDENGRLLTPKQIRARARRRMANNRRKGVLTEQEFEALYKPIEDWDLEELAHGKPRNVDGNFTGRKPSWVTRQVYEKAIEQFTLAIRSGMNAQTVNALDTLKWLLTDEEEDKRGRPLVPPSVKLEASKFLLEHLVGKPTQRVETDISVKLQGILGTVLVNPNDALAPPSQGGLPQLGPGPSATVVDAPAYQVAHLPGHTIPMGTPTDDGDEIWDVEEA
jgi:hypothetical protein